MVDKLTPPYIQYIPKKNMGNSKIGNTIAKVKYISNQQLYNQNILVNLRAQQEYRTKIYNSRCEIVSIKYPNNGDFLSLTTCPIYSADNKSNINAWWTEQHNLNQKNIDTANKYGISFKKNTSPTLASLIYIQQRLDGLKALKYAQQHFNPAHDIEYRILEALIQESRLRIPKEILESIGFNPE